MAWRLARRAMLYGGGVATLYVAVVVVSLPLLTDVLGGTGEKARGPIVAMAVMAALTLPSFVATGLLRAIRRPDLVLRARLVSAVPVLSAGVFGALWDGARGVAILSVVAQVLALPVWWQAVRASGTDPGVELSTFS